MKKKRNRANTHGRYILSGDKLRQLRSERNLSQHDLAHLAGLSPADSDTERQVVHSGHEFVYCLQGRIEHVIDGKVYLMETDDILIFEATLPHLWHNPLDTQAKSILVPQTPNASREPVQRHFSSHPSIKHIGGK